MPSTPTWPENIDYLAHSLAAIISESSAGAALLIRGRQLIVFAGQVSREEADDLAQRIVASWAKKNASGPIAQARFIRLSRSADYLVYSTLAAEDLVLSLAFPAKTPLGQIRKQAKRAIAALFNLPAGETIGAASQTTAAIPAKTDTYFEPVATSSPSPTALRSAAPATGEPALETTSQPPLATAFQPDWIPMSTFVPQVPSVPAVPSVPTIPLHLRRAPHGLYDLSYSFLLLPCLPQTRLTGDLEAQLAKHLWTLTDAYEWQLQFIQIEPDHVEISLRCPPADAPEMIIQILRRETSAKLLADNPHLAPSHAQRPGAFWASGYYVVAPGRCLASEEISAFIQYQRGE